MVVRFLPQKAFAACAPHRSSPIILQQLRGGEGSDDTAALICQLQTAENALQALEREGDKSATALARKSELEQSVTSGVVELRASGMPDDEIMMRIMGQPPTAQSPPSLSTAPDRARVKEARQDEARVSDPVSDRPLSTGVANGIILIRDKDGSIRPFVLVHGLEITDPSTGEGMAECVCMLNAPESYKPSGFSIEISVNSIREVTQAMFVHVEESAVLGMLHDATDGAYGTAATAPAAINLPACFK